MKTPATPTAPQSPVLTYSDDYEQRMVELIKEVIAQQKFLYHAVQRASIAGVYEVTIKSLDTSITVVMDDFNGRQVADRVADSLDSQIEDLQNQLAIWVKNWKESKFDH